MSNVTYHIRCGTNSLSSVDALIDVKPLPESTWLIIIWTAVQLRFSAILIEVWNLYFNDILVKISATKSRPFC